MLHRPPYHRPPSARSSTDKRAALASGGLARIARLAGLRGYVEPGQNRRAFYYILKRAKAGAAVGG
jgi:hypothetical protein